MSYDICVRANSAQAFWDWAVAQGYVRIETLDDATTAPVLIGDTLSIYGPFRPVVSEPGVEPIVKHTDPHFDIQIRGDDPQASSKEGVRVVEIPPHDELVRRGVVQETDTTPALAKQGDDVAVIVPPITNRKHFFTR